MTTDEVTKGATIPEVCHQPDEVELFQFSAASWLTHRIHYDREYARSEGHRDLVVHGPLQGAYLGQMVSNWISAVGGRLTRLTYRNVGPAFVGELLVCKGRVEDVVQDASGTRGTCGVWVEKAGTGERTTTGTAEVLIPRAGVRRTER